MRPIPISIRARPREKSLQISKGRSSTIGSPDMAPAVRLRGVARVLAKEMPDTKIIVCEPDEAQLLSSGIEQLRNPDGSAAAPHPAFKPHPMQGWTPDFIPKLTADAVAMKVIDRIITLPGSEAIHSLRQLARHAGILVEISRGSALV